MQDRIEGLRRLRPATAGIVAASPNRGVETRQLPGGRGLPVADLNGPGDAWLPPAINFWNEENARGGYRPAGSYVVSPERAVWARLIQTLGLVAAPRPADSLNDFDIRSLACILLEPSARSAVFVRSPVYGNQQDICSTLYLGDDVSRGSALSASARSALREGAAAFRARELPRIIAGAPALPLRALVRWPASLNRRYDPARGGYPLVQSVPGGANGLLGTPLDLPTHRLWPVTETEASAFEARQRGRRSEPYFALEVTIHGTTPPRPGARENLEATGLPGGATWRIESGDLSLYEDRELTRRLHVFTRDGGALPEPAGSVAEAPRHVAPMARAVPGGDAEANGAAAAREWGLPLHDGVPLAQAPLGTRLVAPEGGGEITDPRSDETAAFPLAVAAWSRTVYALTLAAAPEAATSLSPEALRRLACVFLSQAERTAIYGRHAAYGNRQDVCQPPGDMGRAELMGLFRAGSEVFAMRQLPELVRRAARLPLRLTLAIPVAVWDYDRAAGGLRLQAAVPEQEPRLFGVSIDTRVPPLWPVSEAGAAAFETRNPGRPRRTFLTVPVTILSASAPQPGRSPLDVDPRRLQIEEGPATLYEDARLTRVLHRFTPEGGATAASPGAVSAAGMEAVVRRWGMPTLRGLPVIGPDHGGRDQLLDLNQGLQGNQPSELAWTRAIRALMLSRTSQTDMRPEALLAYTCLYLSPSRIAALGSARYCGGTGVSPGQEFAAMDAAAEFRTRDLPGILAAAPSLPFEMILVTRLRPEAWSRERSGFPIAAPTTRDLSLFGSSLGARVPTFWPTNEAAARAFTAAQPAANPLGNWQEERNRGAVFLATRLAVTGYTPPASRESQPRWQFDVREMTLYADPALTRSLHSFGQPPVAPSPALGTLAASTPRPAGPVQLGSDTLLLAALKAGVDPGSVNWTQAAEARNSLEMPLQSDPSWARRDPWGIFFPRYREGYRLSPGDLPAFQAWTEARAKVLPGSLAILLHAQPAQGPRRVQLFQPSLDPAFRSSSALASGTPSVSSAMAEALRARGIAQEQLVGLSGRPSGLDLPVMVAVPQSRDTYVLPIEADIPARPSWDREGTENAVLEARMVLDGAEVLEVTEGSRSQRLLLLRLQPEEATLRARPDDRVIARMGFARTAWSAPTPPQPALWPSAAPGAAPQILASPNGPEFAGIKLGMTLAEADTALRARMNVGEVLEMGIPNPASQPAERALANAVTGRMFVSDDLQERVAVLVSRVAPEDRVVAVWRRAYLEQDGWSAELARLTDLYGRPLQALTMPSGQSSAIWGHPSLQRADGRPQCVGGGPPTLWSAWGAGPLQAAQYDLPRTPSPGNTDVTGCFPVLNVVFGPRSSIADNRPIPVVAVMTDLRLLGWLREQGHSVPPRIATVAEAASRQPSPVIPAPAVRGPDVVGLRLGMTMAEAEEAIRKHMPVARVFETAPPSPGEAASPLGLFRGRLFVGQDRPSSTFSERIVIFEAPPEAAGQVVAIARSLFVEQGLEGRVRESLVSKYGPPNPQASIQSRMFWTERQGRECADVDSGRGGGSGLRWQEVGESTRRDRISLSTVEQALPVPTAPERQSTYARCGTVVRVRMERSGSGADMVDLREVETDLFDLALIARLMRRRAEAPPSAVEGPRIRF